jgi:hypothetical protein
MYHMKMCAVEQLDQSIGKQEMTGLVKFSTEEEAVTTVVVHHQLRR